MSCWQPPARETGIHGVVRPENPSAARSAREAGDHREDHGHFARHDGSGLGGSASRSILDDRERTQAAAGLSRACRLGGLMFRPTPLALHRGDRGPARVSISGGPSLVAVMKTADLRDRDDGLGLDDDDDVAPTGPNPGQSDSEEPVCRRQAGTPSAALVPVGWWRGARISSCIAARERADALTAASSATRAVFMAAEGIDQRPPHQDEQRPAATGAAPQSTPMGFSGATGAASRIRTCDPRIRSETQQLTQGAVLVGFFRSGAGFGGKLVACSSRPDFPWFRPSLPPGMPPGWR